MKSKVRRILLCVFFALFIVTLFTASFTLGRYSSVENSEGDYSGDIEYVVSDQVVIYTVEDFYTAIKNGYSNIKIADSVQDPFIISGTVSEVRTDLTIDLNGHQIQRNSRLPLLQVVQNVYLTILDSKSGGSLYNPVGSVLQVSGGTLTIAAGAYESGPRGENSRHAQGDEAISNSYNEYTYVDTDGTIKTHVDAYISQSADLEVTTNNEAQTKLNEETVPIIIPSVDVGQEHVTVNGNMYFSTTGYSQNLDLIPEDTYLYFTIDSDTVDNTTLLSKDGGADYFYSYYLTRNADGNYSYNNNSSTDENAVKVTVFIYNDVKDYITDDRSDHVRTSFAAIEIESGNLYARNGDYYSYFGVNNTYCVDSEGGYMSVTQGDFYAYKNGVCVTCSTETATGEMLNISNGSFYSELGDTVRVTNGNLVIGSADFTKDVGNASANSFGDNGNVIDISGGTLTINTRAGFDVSGSGVRGIYSHDGDNTSVRVANATFNFNTNGDSLYNAGIFARAGSVSCESKTTINFSSGNGLKAQHVCGIYSAGGTIECGIPQTHLEETGLTINIATSGSCENSYGIYANGGDTITHDTTNITIGNTGSVVTSSQGIHAENGEVNLGKLYSEGSVNSRTGDTTITVNGSVSNDENVTSSAHNFGIQTVGGHINTYGTTSVTVYGTNSTGVYATVPNTTSTSSINISGSQFNCYVYDMPTTLPDGYTHTISSTAVSTEGGQINFNVANADITSDGFGITASNTIYVDTNDDNVADAPRPVESSDTYNPGLVQLTASTTATTVGLTSNNSTAIYIYGGELLVNSGITLNVKSTIRPYGWASRNNTVSTTNGIYIVGGSFTSHGAVNITNEVTGTWQYGDNRDDNMFSAGGIANTNVSNFNGIFIDGGSFESSDAENSTAKASLGLNNSISATYQIWEERHWSWEVGWVPEGYSSVDTWYSFNNSSYSGIYVNGGSFIATGTGQITVGEGNNALTTTGLYVSHQGVENDDVGEGTNARINKSALINNNDGEDYYDSTNAYYQFVIKSYAVRVEGIITGYDENNDPIYSSDVTITKGNIVNQVTGSDGNQVGGGGGIYVSNGEVELGQVGAPTDNDLFITTTGTDAFDEYYRVANASRNWTARMPITGGHAVQVASGELTINSGTYTSALGNGILLTDGNVYVHGGTIVGGDHTYKSAMAGDPPCGAAASYCLKVCGGTIEIDGGTFGSPKTVTATDDLVSSSGAFIMGISADNRGTANISKGTFNVGGQAAFAVYQYATATFDSVSTTNPNDDIYVRGLAAGLTVESTNNSDRNIEVTIRDGEFRGFRNDGGDGIWFGNRHATLNIYGGEFVGETRNGRSGLYINCSTDDIQNINIYGGTFRCEGNNNSGIKVDDGASGMTVQSIIGAINDIRDVTNYTFYNNAGSEFTVNGNSTIIQNQFAGAVMSYIRIVQNSTTN